MGSSFISKSRVGTYPVVEYSFKWAQWAKDEILCRSAESQTEEVVIKLRPKEWVQVGTTHPLGP